LKLGLNQLLADFPFLITGKLSEQLSECKPTMDKNASQRAPSESQDISQLPMKVSAAQDAALHIHVLGSF